jgi:hypothetical protein
MLLPGLSTATADLCATLSGITHHVRAVQLAYPDIAKGNTSAVILQEDWTAGGFEKFFREFKFRSLFLLVPFRDQFRPFTAGCMIDNKVYCPGVIQPALQMRIAVASRFEQNPHPVPLARLFSNARRAPTRPYSAPAARSGFPLTL